MHIGRCCQLIIGATSDIHSPRHFDRFLRALDKLDFSDRRMDLFLIAGDMVHRGDVEEYDRVSNAMFGKIRCPIVACFGNNEYMEKQNDIRKRVNNIKFLDDSSTTLRLNIPGLNRELVVGIVGTTGSLETPTPWQRSNIPDIEELYSSRIGVVERHLKMLRVDFKILLMHYAPTYKTLSGENPRFYTSMGWNVYENVLKEQEPDLVLHGHSHRGSKKAWIDSVPVLNVAFPVNEGIVLIDTDQLKPGLTRFV